MAAAKTALLILGILLLAADSARSAETDPIRRSLVVQAVERAGPAVVNVSTEESENFLADLEVDLADAEEDDDDDADDDDEVDYRAVLADFDPGNDRLN